MLDLTIETKDKFHEGDIYNAYEIAMNKTIISGFIQVLKSELPAYEVIQSGSHIAIHREDKRVAIITNIK